VERHRRARLDLDRHLEVVAFDQQGDYSQIFSLNSNMLHFVVSFNTGYHGPVITMTGPGLDYTYPSGGYCVCPSAEVPVEIQAGSPVTFHWSATALTPCDREGMRSYRWTLDIRRRFRPDAAGGRTDGPRR
jgi:hypothetical protein